MKVTCTTLPVEDVIKAHDEFQKYGADLSATIRDMKMYNHFSEMKSAGTWTNWEEFAHAHCLSVIQAKRIIYKLVKQFPLKVNAA